MTEGKGPNLDGARTRAVHAGGPSGDQNGCEGTPVHRTSGFTFPSLHQMTETFSGRTGRYIYTRFDNPSLREPEEKLLSLERAPAGAGCVVFSSGMAALTAALMAVLASGEHLVAQEEIYGGTTGLLGRVLPRCGIGCDFISVDDLVRPERLTAAGRPATKAVLLESPCNPTMRVVDLGAVARVARQKGWVVIVDNTIASPVLQRPFEHGCDVIVHSATKYLAGHDDLTAGFALASGDILSRIRQLRIDLGGCLDPSIAWLLARSMKTVALRVAAQSANALAVARHLVNHPRVARVHYPGLPSHPDHALASRQMAGFGSMLAFDLADGVDTARFVESLRMIRLVPTFGGLATTVTVPAASSHFGLTREARLKMGVGDGMIRLSSGIEDPADIISDLDFALV